MEDLIFETVDKDKVPETYYPEPETYRLREIIVALGFEKALKFTCGSNAEAKHLQAASHQAAAYIRRTMGVTFSMRTQVNEEELTKAKQKKYESSPHKGTFPRTTHLYIWKEPVEK